MLPQRYVFSSKSQRSAIDFNKKIGCCCYHKGTYFQANHNGNSSTLFRNSVVVATTKVRIFKQITTVVLNLCRLFVLLLLPQRYVFSSKSQLLPKLLSIFFVVVATTKVRIFKQITTEGTKTLKAMVLLLLPQRYVFSSKSQLAINING